MTDFKCNDQVILISKEEICVPIVFTHGFPIDDSESFAGIIKKVEEDGTCVVVFSKREMTVRLNPAVLRKLDIN